MVLTEEFKEKLLKKRFVWLYIKNICITMYPSIRLLELINSGVKYEFIEWDINKFIVK